MHENNLITLRELGQSIWLDTLSRDLVDSGELEHLINIGITGVTTNPSIFERVIMGSDRYDKHIMSLAKLGLAPEIVYRDLAFRDVDCAADLLSEVYKNTDAADGYVSIEVSPHSAHDTEATINEARDIWYSLARKNVMIKVPGTAAGLPAITRLIGEGINVNVTLLFSVERYLEVADCYLSGLELLSEAGKDLHEVASVASFFLSRIDTLIDPRLAAHPAGASEQGETAIALARLAYSHFEALSQSARFLRLKKRGARPQRLLWASTSTKNPNYTDTHYVEPLIGPDTVNTMPTSTLHAFMDHGNAQVTLDKNREKAANLVDSLSTWGIDLDLATRQLEKQGINKFIQSHDRLMHAIRQKLDAHELRHVSV